MKAAFLTGIRQLEIREAPDPEIRDGHDVLLKIDTVGVCGSDVHYYNEGRIGEMVVEYPCMTGHECSAVIAEVGPEVTSVSVGDRVAIDPLIYCGRCDQCLSGRRHTCRDQRFLACPGQGPGALSERLVMPDYCCVPLPESVSLEAAALVEPLSVGVYAQRLSQMTGGETVAVLGSGPIGLCTMAAARAGGATKIFATDRIDPRVEFATTFGADWAGNPDEQDVVAEMLSACPEGLDVVFECAGQQDTIDQALELLRPGGKLVLIGIPAVERISLLIDRCRRKELSIQNVRRQNECVQAAIDMVDDGRINVDALATHHFSLDETQAAFDLVADYRDGVIKAMVHMS